MIRSAVTVSLVIASAGRAVCILGRFGGRLRKGCKQLGFDAVEIFAPSVLRRSMDSELRRVLDRLHLQVAAVGTGAGMVIHGLSLTDPDAAQRQQAEQFIRQMIDFGGPLGAPAIIGSMQGRWGGDLLDRDAALGLLREALNELGEHAASVTAFR